MKESQCRRHGILFDPEVYTARWFTRLPKKKMLKLMDFLFDEDILPPGTPDNLERCYREEDQEQEGTMNGQT